MASDIRSRIGIDGEASYRQAIKAIIQDQNKLKKEMTETAKAFSSNASEQEKARTKSQQLTRQLELANGKLKEQKDALKALEQDGKGASREAVNLRNSIKVTEAEIAALNKELRENSKLAAFGRDMQDVGKKMQSIGGKISGVGDKLTKGVTLPLAAAGAAAVKLAVEFESSMAKLDTIADASEKSIGDLRKEIMALSDATGISASELAEQTYQAISAGRSTAEAVQFVGKATKLSKAGFADTGAALDVLTTIMNAYGKSESEVAKISDQLITTQNLGKTTVGQLAENMGQVIPTAAAFGVSMENINSAYVTLTKQGINTASATTSINGLLNQLGKSGTTSAKVLKDKTGKSFKELMDDGASLADVLAIIKEEAEANGLSLSDMFGNVRAGKAALAIMNDDGVTFAKSLEAMGKAAGSTDKAFAKLENTTAFKFQKSLNRVKNSGIEAGQALLISFAPTLEKIAGIIEKAAKRFDLLSSEEQQAVVKTLAFAAAAGPMTKALGGMTTGLGKAIEGAGKLAEAWGIAGKLTTELALGGTAAIAALTAALAIYTKKRYEATNEEHQANKAVEDGIRASQRLVESVKQEGAEYKASIDAIEQKGKKADSLVGTLDRLSKKTNRTADDEKKMSSAVAELNALYPELNLSYDRQTGLLSKSTDEIKKNIAALKQQATAAAMQERMAKNASALLDIEQQIAKQERIEAEAAKAAADAEANLGRQIGGNRVPMSVQKAQLHELQGNARSAAEATTALKKEQQDLEKEQDKLAEGIGDLADATGDLADINKDSAESGYLMTDGFEAEQDALDEVTQKVIEAGKLQVGVFDEVAEAQKTSLDEMKKGLQSQIDAYNNWSKNLKTATEYANKSGSREINSLVRTIAEMGTQGAPYMQALVDAIESGSDDAIAELAALASGVAQAEGEYEDGLSNYLTATNATMRKIPSAITSQRPKIVTAAKQNAQGVATGTKQGMATAGATMYTDTATAAAKVPAAVRAKYADAKAAGQGLPDNVAAGAGKSTNIASKGTAQANSFVSAVRGKYSAAVSAGEYMASGLAVGIKNKASYINSVASNVASTAIKTMRNVAQVKSPSRVTKEIGGYIAEGLALGMRNELPMVTSAATKIANAAIPSINPYATLQSNSLNPDDMYAAVRSGASQATQQIFLNTRELTRGLKSMGVVFNE